jgi:N-carbamoyl-L-amino-acid hydrolase
MAGYNPRALGRTGPYPSATMPTLQQLNDATDHEAVALLDGIYEYTPWVARRAIAARPFRSLSHLVHAMHAAVMAATREEQLALVRAHPELGGRAMVAGTLTAASAAEQSRSGLTHCTPEEFGRLRELNATYNEKFGFPFILAIGGPRGTGLGRAEIIATLARRLDSHPDDELAECLRNIGRIAELRLAQRFGENPDDGNWVWDRAEALAVHSDPPFAEAGQLTVTYLTEAHRACASDLAAWVRDAGFDDVAIDAVGNVRARLRAASERPAGGTLYTGSHYDTVRNGGKYDGRLGILVPLAVVRRLKAAGTRLPYHLELIAFAEEEGQRFPATFLGSSAVIGRFDPAWLEQVDASGTSLRQAMLAAGLDPAAIPGCRLDPSDALGFIEVHIEQGPVLEELGLPLGVVSSINGSMRFAGEVTGVASHAGTTPMDRRRDAALAVAELALHVERRAAQERDAVGTVGVLEVPAGSINVVPGRCRFTLDLRAPDDGQRDRLVKDVLDALERICQRRGLRYRIEETLRVGAAASDPVWQRRWELAVEALGLPVHRMPSGAGHDAMKMHEAMPQAMLFVRGGNGGISHNPLETITAHDAQRCVDAFDACLRQLGRDMAGDTVDERG